MGYTQPFENGRFGSFQKEASVEKVLVVVVMAALVLFGLSSPVDPVRYLGATSIPTDEWTFGTMPVGGISGLAYDPATDLTYAVSDDRGETGTPGRLYTLKIAVDQRGIRRVQVVGVAFLDSDPKTPGIQPYAPKSIDAEEVVLTPDGNLIISSERDLENRPWIREFAPDGSFLREIPLPEAFVPSPGRGTRTNFAFEGLGLTPAGDTLYVANEEALEQDGPLATVDHGTTVRILEYDLTTQTPSLRAEYAYVTEPIFASAKDGPSDNGVSAMAYVKNLWPEYDLLVLERAFATGVGNDVKLFGVKLAGADDVNDAASLPFPYAGKAASKTLLARLSALPGVSKIPLKPDNLESITVGPALSADRFTLFLASDNNFNPTQTNQFLALEVVPPPPPGATESRYHCKFCPTGD